MDAQLTLGLASNLKVYDPKPNWLKDEKQEPRTPNEWFAKHYPEQVQIYGSPFIELTQLIDQFTDQVSPISINFDFFAGILGGRKDLGHHTIYFEPEMQFYFFDVADQLYKATTQEKLANQYRAVMQRSCSEMPANVHKLNLFHEFRSDKIAKQIVHRAKSILAADETFFGVDSKHIRMLGTELPERLGRVFVESMLEQRDGSLLTLTQAYNLFCNLSLQRNLTPIKKTTFREMMRDMMKDAFGISIRRDLPNEQNKQQEGWKGVTVNLGGEVKAEAA